MRIHRGKTSLVLVAAIGIAFALAAQWSLRGHAGKAVYDRQCAACHEVGAHGAPRAGHRDEWTARLARGDESLYGAALRGMTSGDRHMPPRGGDPKLTDREVKAAVDYLVARSR